MSNIIAQGYTDLLEYFIDSLDDLSDMNVRDDILATPAHDAAEFGEINSLLVLLKHGADITIKDKVSIAKMSKYKLVTRHCFCRKVKRHTTWQWKRTIQK